VGTINFQSSVVTVLVAASFAYAIWTLMPQGLRASVARRLLRLPFPGFMQRRLAAAADQGAGCGCAGCDKAPALKAQAGNATQFSPAQPLVFHPRKAQK